MNNHHSKTITKSRASSSFCCQEWKFSHNPLGITSKCSHTTHLGTIMTTTIPPPLLKVIKWACNLEWYLTLAKTMSQTQIRAAPSPEMLKQSSRILSQVRRRARIIAAQSMQSEWKCRYNINVAVVAIVPPPLHQYHLTMHYCILF